MFRHLKTWFQEYLLAAIVVFPEVWLHSVELQALLPAKLVSTVAPFVGGIGLAVRLYQARARLPLPRPTVPDDTDQAGA